MRLKILGEYILKPSVYAENKVKMPHTPLFITFYGSKSDLGSVATGGGDGRWSEE
jgi:hypothetical protein